MNTILEQINTTGKSFVEFALPMLAQFSILFLILLFIDFLLRKKVRAIFCYWIWMLVLVKLILPTSLSSPLSVGYLFGDKLTSLPATPTPLEQPRPPATITMPIIDLTDIPQDLHTQPAPMVTSRPEPIPAQPIAPPPVPPAALSWQGVVFLLWLAVVIAMALLLLQRAIFVKGLVAQAIEADNRMKDVLDYCCQGMGLKKKVTLKVSSNATSPAVCGLFRPVILLPHNLSQGLRAGELQAVLLHELAHIRRYDLWVNLAQTILQILYFYNPLLWITNAIIRRIREQAVDEMVLVAMGDRAKQYPQTLVSVAKLAFKRPVLSLRLIGVVESKSALASRIKHILTQPTPKKAKLGIVGIVTIIVTAAVLLPMAKAQKQVDRQTDVQVEGEGGKHFEQRFELGKDIPVQLKVGKVDDWIIVSAKTIRFEKDEDNIGVELTADVRKGFGMEWKTKLELLDVNNKVLDARTVTEGNHALSDPPVMSPLKLEFLPFQWDTISDAVSFRVSFEQLSPISDALGRELTSSPKELIQGRITDPKGQPVADAVVTIAEYKPGANRLHVPKVSTNQRGYYKLGQVDWPYYIVVQRLLPASSGRFSPYQEILLKKVLKGPQTVDLQFDEFPRGSASLECHVVDKHGKAVEKFHFVVLDDVDWETINYNDPAGGYIHTKTYRMDVDRTEGRFSVEDLPAGNYKIWIIPKDKRYEDTTEKTLIEEGAHVKKIIEVPSNYVLYGRVLFEDNSPAVVKPVPWPGARTSIIMPVGKGGIALGVANVDDDGYFTIYLNQLEIEQLRSGESRLIIDAPTAEEGHYKSMGEFPFELLAEQRDKAGAVKIKRPQTDVQVEGADGKIPLVWGPAVEGVQVRLRADKVSWDAGEKPTFKADIRNHGVLELFVRAVDERCQLEIDGEWYNWSGPWGRSRVERSPLGPGSQINNISISLEKNWVGRKRLILTPGKHIVRVAFVTERKDKDSGPPVRALSNPVEIEQKKEKREQLQEQPVIRAVENKATLTTGLAVELLGVTRVPVRNQPWWKPDGSPLEEPLFDWVDTDPSKDPNRDQFAYYAVTIRLDGSPPEQLGLMKWNFTGSVYAGTTGAYIGDRGLYAKNIHAAAAKFSKGIETTTLHLGIVSGEWQTLFVGSHYGFYEKDGDSVYVSTPEIGGGLGLVGPDEKGLHIAVTYNITDRDFRVVAVDKEGNVHISSRSGSGGTKNLYRTTASFPDLTREQLQEYRFQVRQYEWVEFKDISLRPGKEAIALYEKRKAARLEEIEKWLGQGQTRQIRQQILILRQCPNIFQESEKWAAAIRELVTIGRPAVPELIAELHRSERRAPRTLIAFTLRAISDSQAVPALIEELGRSEYKGEYALNLKDKQLSAFIQKYQDRPPRAGDNKVNYVIIGCPVIEITAALEKITGHSEGHEHFGRKAVEELGPNAPSEQWQKRVQEIVKETADRWQKWWDQHKDEFASR